MAISRWHGGKLVTAWALGLVLSQLLFMYALRPGGALMSLVAHIVVPLVLLGITRDWFRGVDAQRLRRVTGQQLGVIAAAWLVAVAALFVWPTIWQATASDPNWADAVSGPLRRLGWFVLIPALVALLWFTWKWFGAQEGED